MILTEEEFLEWKTSPVTKEFFRLLLLKREEFKEDLILSVYENEETVKGKALVLQELMEMKYEDMSEEMYARK